MKTKITSTSKKIVADILTPVGLYLKIRDSFPNALLLESSDYNQKQNSYSYICLSPLASFEANQESIHITYPDGSKDNFSMESKSLTIALHEFTQSFDVIAESLGFLSQGLFGYTSYDAIPLHHPITFQHSPMKQALVHYQYFQFVLVFNHFNNELFLIENLLEGAQSQMSVLEQILNQKNTATFPFTTLDLEESNYNDDAFLDIIKQGQAHCFRGDVFQVVLSRQFSQSFKGDEFNVYRALRSINPSPYLFYFDYGSYKIMGSSPEAQITIHDHKATINPIAGTYKRTGVLEQDEMLTEALKNDPKENAEHVMLVDLARNDLSINSDDVMVKKYKSVELYSHVIHLVSKVEASLPANHNAIEIFLNTFPAGTLSGAPKHKAMQIIDRLENTNRAFYGGAVGIIGLDGSLNHAIFIRSIWSASQRLFYQAGCGVVAQSNPESELQEIYNKLNAVKSAITLAQNLQ